jgi:GTPase SAR1 family protein
MSFLVTVGFAGVGSSEVRENYLGKGFSSNYMMTVGADFANKNMNIRDKSIRFQIWDLAGSPKTVRTIYYYGKFGFLIFYKKNDRDSFGDAPQWFEGFKKHNGNPISLFSRDNFALIGIIQEPEIVTKDAGEILAEQLGMNYYEIDLTNVKPMNEILYKIGKWYLDFITQNMAKS